MFVYGLPAAVFSHYFTSSELILNGHVTGQHACIVEVAVLWTVYAVVTVYQDVPVGR